jgi:hypothetical protein
VTTPTTTEPHPWFHDWYLRGDFVHEETRGGRILSVRREEKCRACAKMRLTVIDVPQWTIRRRVYVGKTKVVRLPRGEYRKQEFLQTTVLSSTNPTVFAQLAQ